MKINSLWRYPVKSMAGENLHRAVMTQNGIIGDRSYAVHDGSSIRGAKKFSRLMSFSASFDDEPDGIVIPSVTLDIGNTALSSDDAEVHHLLSKELGTTVTLEKLRGAEELDYYRQPSEKPNIADIRSILGLLESEPFPDFSEFPAELSEFSTPPGTYFDAYPLLILTTSALGQLQQAAPESVIDERRFRPNIVINTDEIDLGYVEESWKNKYLTIGEVILGLTLPCPRCVMTTIGFQDLPKDPGIMRTLVRENHHKLGIYAQVIRAGHIQVDDEVTLVEEIEPNL